MKKKINNLQALRAIAALNVVLVHIISATNNYLPPFDYYHKMKMLNSFGVDIFFVLSGFIMVYILNNSANTPFNFFLSRACRILPLYWFLNFFLYILVLFFPSIFNNASQITNNFFQSIFFISYIIFQTHPILYDGWTLEYEMFFYLSISISIFFNKNKIKYIFIILFLLFFIFFKFLNLIAIEFILGVILGIIFLALKNNLVLSKESLIIGSLFFIGGLFIKIDTDSLFYNRVILYGFPSVLVIYGLLGVRQVQKGLLTVLGDASYSIYLVQVFSIPAFYKLIVFFNFQSFVAINFLSIICFILTLVSGILLYFFVEKNLIDLFRKVFIIKY